MCAVACAWADDLIVQELLASWRLDNSGPDSNVRTAQTTVAVSSEQQQQEQQDHHWQDKGSCRSVLLEEGPASRSAADLEEERGRELREWKERRVDEAVALIRVSWTALLLLPGSHRGFLCGKTARGRVRYLIADHGA